MAVRRFALAAVAAAAVAALAAPVGAETTTVTGVLGSSVSISTAPSSSVDFDALAVGTNTASAGTLAVSANTSYVVTVQADKASMTEWDGSSYGAGTLANALSLVPSISTGSPVPTTVLAIGTTPQTFMTGTGLTSDAVSLELRQTVASADTPGTYRSVLTYTASEAL